jgi:ABC-type transport system substrate-binding protein
VKADQGCSSCDWSQHDVSLAKTDAASLRQLGSLTLLVDSGQSTDVRTAQAITPMLAQAGITVRTVLVNAATMAARLASGSYEMALRTLSAQAPTPADSLQTLVHDHYVANATSTQAAGTALQAVNAATDLDGTSSAVAAFEEQNFTAAALVPLVDPDVVDVVGTRIRGLALLPSGLYHSAALWLKG